MNIIVLNCLSSPIYFLSYIGYWNDQFDSKKEEHYYLLSYILCHTFYIFKQRISAEILRQLRVAPVCWAARRVSRAVFEKAPQQEEAPLVLLLVPLKACLAIWWSGCAAREQSAFMRQLHKIFEA